MAFDTGTPITALSAPPVTPSPTVSTDRSGEKQARFLANIYGYAKSPCRTTPYKVQDQGPRDERNAGIGLFTVASIL